MDNVRPRNDSAAFAPLLPMILCKDHKYTVLTKIKQTQSTYTKRVTVVTWSVQCYTSQLRNTDYQYTISNKMLGLTTETMPGLSTDPCVLT